MPRGSKPGERRGGRSKGTPNGKTAEKVAAIEASGLTPLDYMLSILRDDNLAMPDRFEAAKAAAPYVHAKLASVESKISGELAVSAGIDRPPSETREQWLERRKRDLASAAALVSTAGTADRSH